MSNIARHHKKPRFKDEAIDVNELASMSNMRGMLSFLDTKPEDYARLFSNASTPPLTDETESIAVSAKSSDITLPSGSSLLPGSNLHSELELLSHDGAVDENPLASKSTDPQALVPNLYPQIIDDLSVASCRIPCEESSSESGSNLPPERNLLPDSNLLPTMKLLPDSNLLPGSGLLSVPAQSDIKKHQPYVRSALRKPGQDDELATRQEKGLLPNDEDGLGTTDTNVLHDSIRPLPGRNLLPGSELRTANGRTVRLRLAKSVQDAHTSGEHLLVTAMWKRGIPESADSRLLKAGMAELTRWTGSHKTSCRAHLRSLATKLAIEEAESFDAAAGKEGARVYRIFSFNTILERRRQANMTHVIRTGAVYFVDPKTGERLPPGSNLLPGGSLRSARNSPPDSRLQGSPGSNHLNLPGSNHLVPTINNCMLQESVITTTTVVQSLQHTFGFADDHAARQIINACRAKAGDATDEEIAYFVQLHGNRILKMRNIENPVGLLIHYLPKCFEGEGLRQFRQERERERQAEVAEALRIEAEIRQLHKQLRATLDDPTSSEDDKRLAMQILVSNCQV